MTPEFCLKCFKPGQYLCANCLKNLDFGIKYFCFHCRRRLSPQNLCLPHHQKPIKYLISFAEYDQKFFKNLIFLSKYEPHGYHKIIEFFGQMIKQEINFLLEKDYYLVPVPMTKRKLLLRGFNQSEILARTLNNKKIFLGLKKIKETKPQAQLNFEERKTNLLGAFLLKEKPPLKLILIDDVITSGETLKICGETLRAGGAKEIIALTILF